MPIVKDQPLSNWPEQSTAQVSRVKTHDPEKLRYLKRVNLTPGKPVKVLTRGPFNGPIHLECNGEPMVLGNELARELYVQTLESG